MTNDPIIYVVDDDADSRDSVAALVSQMAWRVQSFASAEDFLAAYTGYRPACLLTDHRMLGMTGVELLEKLRSNGVSLSVIVMTAFAETDLTVRAIRSGAVTLLEKPFSNTSLWDAIREAITEDRQQAQDEALKLRIEERLTMLTESELDVLKLISRGEPNKSVAAKLNVSIRTVESRRSSIFEKMQVSSVAELVRLVMIARPDLC
ncbi:response regulator transcription factor [Fuerstiella marisgermanici]|uniref:Transcriptional regulatory protein TdiR n=1 Tax=Fuerstiella marisgermanici TaxID=1891926 RepID=A0A1P8WLT7_9PLAN|nr:response regulator [Fuerstiella marisgermanici]APZ95006.1 Transcriptional regulatory protein TdiR [Fuerstiella marisgermanici]